MESILGLKKRFFSWRTLISFAVAFVVLYFLVTRISPEVFWEIAQKIDYGWYLMAFGIYYSSFPVRALRFQVMLKNNGIASNLLPLTNILLISWFTNCIVPAKMGDLYRGYLIKEKYGLSFMKTVGIIFVERVFDLLVLYIVIGVTGLLSFRDRIPDNLLYVMEAGFAFSVILALFTYGLVRHGNIARRWLPEKALILYNKFLSGTIDSFKELGRLALYTSLIWFLEGLSFYCVAKAIGIQFSITSLLFVALISALMTALPVTPAGLGFVEAAKVGVLVLLGLAHEIALSAALLDRLINYWTLIVVGFTLYLLKARRYQKGGNVSEGYDSDTNI